MNQQTEKVPMAIVFRDNGKIIVKTSGDTSLIELYEFWTIYLKKLEENIKNDFKLEGG